MTVAGPTKGTNVPAVNQRAGWANLKQPCDLCSAVVFPTAAAAEGAHGVAWEASGLDDSQTHCPQIARNDGLAREIHGHADTRGLILTLGLGIATKEREGEVSTKDGGNYDPCHWILIQAPGRTLALFPGCW